MGELKITESQMDISDPFILHHSNHPRIVLVSKLLDGRNCGQWSRAMRISRQYLTLWLENNFKKI
jgi:hypothetical protein